MVYVHSAKMRLCEPPVIDASLLAKFYKDLTTLDDNTPSALDLFYRVSSGVREWFDHWFTVPVSAYFYLPVSIICQIVYAVTMLARWSKIVSPIKPLPSSQPRNTISTTSQPPQPTATTSYASTPTSTPAFVPTPSPHYSRACGYGAGPPPDFSQRPPATSSTISTSVPATPGPGPGAPSPSKIPRDISGPVCSRATSTEPPITSTPDPVTNTTTDPTTAPHNPSFSSSNNNKNNPLSSVRWRETTDPQLPHIVAMLQEQLNSQPGLWIDITETMAQLGARFQQASDDMKEASGGEPDSNMWEVSAKGLVMTKAKLERFAEFVAQGGELDDDDQGKGGGERKRGGGSGGGEGRGEDDAACSRLGNRTGTGAGKGTRAGEEQPEGGRASGFLYQEGSTGSSGVGSVGTGADAGTGGPGGVEAGRASAPSGSMSGERYAQVQASLARGGGGETSTSSGGGNTTATQSSQSQPWLASQSQGQGQSMGAPPIPQQQQQQHQQPPFQGHSYANTTAMSGANIHHSLPGNAGVHGGDAGYPSATIGAAGGAAGGGVGGGVGGGQCNNLLATESMFVDQLAPWLWYYGVEDWPAAGPGGV